MAEERNEPPRDGAVDKSSGEIIDAIVLDKIVIVDDGYKYVGFTIEYKGQRVMVTGTVGIPDVNKGESISVMIHKLKLKGVGNDDGSMTFMVMPEMSRKRQLIDERSKVIEGELKASKEKVRDLQKQIDEMTGKSLY